MKFSDEKLKIIGEKVKTSREKRNMTQEQLSEKIGMNKSYIGLIENGVKGMSTPIIEKVADTLNCSVDYLLGREDNKINNLYQEYFFKYISNFYNEIGYKSTENMNEYEQKLLHSTLDYEIYLKSQKKRE